MDGRTDGWIEMDGCIDGWTPLVMSLGYIRPQLFVVIFVLIFT